MIKRDDSHTSALLFCFAKVARYCFEKICSVKLGKTLLCQIFELVLFCFSRDPPNHFFILKIYSVQNGCIAGTSLFVAQY